MSKQIRAVWLFASDSDPSKTYETLKYEDGSLSCSCPGWTRRVAPDGSRSCKHTRLVYLGVAEHSAITFSDYYGVPPLAPAPAEGHRRPKKKHAQGPKPGRKLVL